MEALKVGKAMREKKHLWRALSRTLALWKGRGERGDIFTSETDGEKGEINNRKDVRKSYIKAYSFINLITNIYSVFVCVVHGGVYQPPLPPDATHGQYNKNFNNRQRTFPFKLLATGIQEIPKTL